MSGDSFTKLYSTILMSSVWAESHTTRIVWITMLALADAGGRVDAAVPGLANIARVTIDEALAALDVLSSPDPYSKNSDHDGRRIEKVDRGWQILNYGNYRERRTQTSSDGSYVYYALSGVHVKIGVSKNPWARAADMRTARPDTKIVAVESGGVDLERRRHKQFEADHVEREWFLYSDTIQSHIATLRPVEEPVRESKSTAPLSYPAPLRPATVATVALRNAEAEANTDTETTSPTSAREEPRIADVLSLLTVPGPRRASWVPLLDGMTRGLNTPGMKAVPITVLHEAAQELAASGGEVTPHRFKIFVSKVLERKHREGEGQSLGSATERVSRVRGRTLAASKLVQAVRKLRNPQFPTSLVADWRVEIDKINPLFSGFVYDFGISRFLTETKDDGTLTAQLARAMEEAGL